MIYYQWNKKSIYIHDYDFAIIENELFTKKELQKLHLYSICNLFTKIDLPKSKIYHSFGCRFICHNAR